MRADRARSDDRFERLVNEFLANSARQAAAIQEAFTETRAATPAVNLTRVLERHTELLERHTQILDRIDRNLGIRGDGRPDANGRTS
jgi:hypothetical protein